MTNPFLDEYSGYSGTFLDTTSDDRYNSLPLMPIRFENVRQGLDAILLELGEVGSEVEANCGTGIEHEQPGHSAFHIEDESLCTGQFKYTTGFCMKYYNGPCSPNFVMKPLVRVGGADVPLGAIFHGHSKKTIVASCACCPRLRSNWQTITFRRDGSELFSFIYKPSIWWIKKGERLVDIYASERNTRIGCIKTNHRGVACGAKIRDSVNGNDYRIILITNELSSSIEFVDAEDKVMAVAKPLNSPNDNEVEWTYYQIRFSDEGVQAPAYTKVIFLSALALWSIEKQERSFKKFIFIACGLLLLFFIFLVVIATAS